VVSLTTYRDRGFVPAAFRNFLALLGWSPGTDQEILGLPELIELFSLDGINRADAIFNFDEHDERAWTDAKGLWMNAEYISKMPLDELLPMVQERLEAAGLWSQDYETGGARSAWFRATVELLRARSRTLEDFVTRGRAYWADDFEYDEKAVAKNLKDPSLRELLPALADRLASLTAFEIESVEVALRSLADERGVKAGLLINASRTALTGSSVGPGMFDVFVAIGQERSCQRLRQAAALLPSSSADLQ
jgi:glutamyl-tRNA synthetase